MWTPRRRPAVASHQHERCSASVYSNSYKCLPSKRQQSLRCEIDSSHRDCPNRRASITPPATSFRLYAATLAYPDRSCRKTLAVIYGREQHRVSSRPARSPSFAHDTSSSSDAPPNPPVQNPESQPLTASSCTNLQNRTTEHKNIDLRRTANRTRFPARPSLLRPSFAKTASPRTNTSHTSRKIEGLELRTADPVS